MSFWSNSDDAWNNIMRALELESSFYSLTTVHEGSFLMELKRDNEYYIMTYIIIWDESWTKFIYKYFISCILYSIKQI